MEQQVFFQHFHPEKLIVISPKKIFYLLFSLESTLPTVAQILHWRKKQFLILIETSFS